MSELQEVLISVAGRFADAYRTGEKTVEVRRRRLNVPPKTRIWIYAKLPAGRVELVGRIEAVVADTPTRLWKQYGPRTGLTRVEFFDYVAGCKNACVILLGDLKELVAPPTLGQLRRSKRGFQPPQFATLLPAKSALRRLLLLAESQT